MKFTRDTFFLIIRIFLSFLFIFSGIEKIKDPNAFAAAITNYHILPNFLINFFAISLPWIETFTGILLLFKFFEKENLCIIFSMLSVFTIAVVVALIRGINIDCGCFGTLNSEKVGVQKIVENILILVITAVLFIYDDKKLTVNKDK
ncbi:MauE/DoxX family redox-associated membrane protein [Melioribacteraceae bacterium 4301-Me]|uniref:MauE/DoxX family redox-associated membrane protein n=1 Tax=Pyranulibacter aquaticus TaxID=3163344 RepID=UPI0035971657